jgi:hypothetical protein
LVLSDFRKPCSNFAHKLLLALATFEVRAHEPSGGALRAVADR